MRNWSIAVLLFSGLCFAQPAQNNVAGASRLEMKYLRFMLLNVASIDHSPDAVAQYESSLAMQFGLSTAESAVIHSAGQTLKTHLTQTQQSMKALLAGKTSLSQKDAAALATLNAEREQMIVSLANQILSSVSTVTAARLRSPGRIMASAAAARTKTTAQK
jgi:hypothetical protein